MTDKILSAPKLLEKEESLVKAADDELSKQREIAIERLMKLRLVGMFPFRRKPTYEEADKLTRELNPFWVTELLGLHWAKQNLLEVSSVLIRAHTAMLDEMRPEEPHVVVSWQEYSLLLKFGVDTCTTS